MQQFLDSVVQLVDKYGNEMAFGCVMCSLTCFQGWPREFCACLRSKVFLFVPMHSASEGIFLLLTPDEARHGGLIMNTSLDRRATRHRPRHGKVCVWGGPGGCSVFVAILSLLYNSWFPTAAVVRLHLASRCRQLGLSSPPKLLVLIEIGALFIQTSRHLVLSIRCFRAASACGSFLVCR